MPRVTKGRGVREAWQWQVSTQSLSIPFERRLTRIPIPLRKEAVEEGRLGGEADGASVCEEVAAGDEPDLGAVHEDLYLLAGGV